MIIDKLQKYLTIKPRLNEIIFLFGILVFTAILILGLFPSQEAGKGMGKSFFLYSIGTIPILAAIYFIIISFRRKLAVDTIEVVSSIRFKIALAFVFVAILPSVPIILISNKMASSIISELITEKTSESLEESIKMSRESIADRYAMLEKELEVYDYQLSSGLVSPNSFLGPGGTANLYGIKGYLFGVYTVITARDGLNRVSEISKPTDCGESIVKFLEITPVEKGRKIYNLAVGEKTLLLGTFQRYGRTYVLGTIIPKEFYSRISLFKDSLGNYKEREYLKPYFQTGLGLFLLMLAILIVVLSIIASLLLSKNITKPVYELENAAREVASGNFNIRLIRNSSDEMALLFGSFNKMARQLAESRQVLIHSQKLEAWRDVARKLLHELKNPLTPIRLSAERIKKKFKENHADLDEVILTGTDTIIQEVNALMQILNEFTKYARLPEINPEMENLNQCIENYVKFFHGHEKVNFHLELPEDLPNIYFDKILMRQVFTNIIQNSIDAIQEKGNITVVAGIREEDGGNVAITIRDDGMGIDEENLNKIFDPSFSTKSHGTGLGLAIVEKIINEHGGKIYCRSEKGKGTEFIIELPLPEGGEHANGKDTSS